MASFLSILGGIYKRKEGIDLSKAMSFLRGVSYEVRGQQYSATVFAITLEIINCEIMGVSKGRLLQRRLLLLAFNDRPQPIHLFEGFIDFISFLLTKEDVVNSWLALNSVANIHRAVDECLRRERVSQR